MPDLWASLEARAAMRARRRRPAVAQTLPGDDMLIRAMPQAVKEPDAVVASAWSRFGERSTLAPEQARAFADTNEWVRAAVNKIKGRVARSERGIVPVNADKPINPTLQARIAYLIENPNPRGDSWRSFIEPVIEDYLVLGKGGFEYVKNFRGWPLALIPFDAQYMTVDPDWDGRSPTAPRYTWKPPRRTAIGLRNDEITLMLDNPATHRAQGLSRLDTLRSAIEADAAGNAFVRDMLKKYPPPGWLHLGETSTPRQVREVRDALNAEVLGRGGIMVTGNMREPKYESLWAGNSRDNQLQEWSHYFARKICAVFMISPQDLGLTMDVNKATGAQQHELSMEDGFKSVLTLVEEYVNREVVAKFGAPEAINLRFAFKELTAKDRLAAAQYVALIQTMPVPTMTLNELRAELDQDPLELGDAIYVRTGTGVTTVIGDDAEEFRRTRAEEAAEHMELMAQDEGTPDPNQPTTPEGGDAGANAQKPAPANQSPQGGA